MRKVTKNAVQALKNFKKFTCGNTHVELEEFGTHKLAKLYLHGNLLAQLDASTGQLHIYDGGRESNVTKERLNGILNEFNLGYIHQKNWNWFFTKTHFGTPITEPRRGHLEFDIYWSKQN